MNSNSAQLCRLCLETSAGLLNIFEKFEDSTISSVLATHFWFEINKDDGMPDWVCDTCWTYTKTFHHFYKRLELRHQQHMIDEIKRERSVSPFGEGGLEADLAVDEYEEETETTEEAKDAQILSKESNCDEDDRHKGSDRSEADQSLVNPIKGHNHRAEVEKQDAEIRKFFQMKCEICNDFEIDSIKTAKKHYREMHNTQGYLTCCGTKYTQRFLMLDHVQCHGNPEAPVCEQCNKTFSTRHALRLHAKIHVRTHQCSLCSKTYSSAVQLKYHVRDTHPTEWSVRLHCDICGRTYPTKKAMFSHMKYAHGPSSRGISEKDAKIRKFFQITCEICSDDVEFDTFRTAKEHCRKVHKTQFYLMCCGTKYPKRSMLLEHIQYHVDPEAHRCERCNKIFRSIEALKTHVKIHAPSRLKLKCGSCSKLYSTAAALNAHVEQKHTTDTSAKFHCDICRRAYARKKSLTNHIKTYHESTRGHICDGCGRKFKSKIDLKYHIEIEHSTTPPPKAQCDICGAWVKHKRYLRFHLKIHEDEKDAQNGNGNVSCPICKKKINYKRSLADHIAIVHGERKHQCTFCDKAFTQPKSLKEHMAIHTGMDLYDCPYCDKTFKSNANMYAHRKKAHLAEWTSDRTEKTGKSLTE